MKGHRKVEQAALLYEFRSIGTYQPIICCARSIGSWSLVT